MGDVTPVLRRYHVTMSLWVEAPGIDVADERITDWLNDTPDIVDGGIAGWNTVEGDLVADNNAS